MNGNTKYVILYFNIGDFKKYHPSLMGTYRNTLNGTIRSLFYTDQYHIEFGKMETHVTQELEGGTIQYYYRQNASELIGLLLRKIEDSVKFVNVQKLDIKINPPKKSLWQLFIEALENPPKIRLR